MVIKKSFYFTAEIIRDSARVVRQGTLNAKDEFEAIDKVYEMGQKVWKRPVLEVNILGNGTGEVLATSTIGDRVQNNLLPLASPAANDAKKPAGMLPWPDPPDPPVVAHEIGTYFTPASYGRLTAFEK